MLKIFKGMLLMVLCLVFILALFILPRITGSIPEVDATFGACSSSVPTTVSTQNYSGDGSLMTLTGPMVKIIPTAWKSNEFDVVYSDDSLISGLINCKEVGYGYYNTMTDYNLNCTGQGQNSFMAGMEWENSLRNKRRIYCCSSNLEGSGSTWTVPYDYDTTTGTGITADCSFDADGNPVEGGLMVGLINYSASSNSTFNKGSAVCKKFGIFPKDIRTSLSCGDLGETYQGRVICTGGTIKNYGCDLSSDVYFNSDDGLGVVYYANVKDADGNIISARVTLDDVLDGQAWKTGYKQNQTLFANIVNIQSNGQLPDVTISDLIGDEQYITVCARAEAESASVRHNNCSTVLVTANKPDLIVDDASCVGCTMEGDYYFAGLGDFLTIKGAIKNQGRASSSAISQNQIGVTFAVDGSDDPVAKFALSALDPGSSASQEPGGTAFQYSLNFPANFSSNKWKDYQICVDPPGTLGGGYPNDKDGDILESGGKSYLRDNQASNCKVIRVSALLPNLVVPVLEGPASVVPVGSTKNLTLSVENVGASASGAATVKVYQHISSSNYKEVCNIDVPALGKAGSANAVSDTFSCQVTFDVKKDHKFYARVDEEHAIDEISDDDNQSETITVVADFADLVVSEIECSPENIVDENFSCTAKVKNIGLAPLSSNLSDGIKFYSGTIFAGTYSSGCYRSGFFWYCYINGLGRQKCNGNFIATLIAGTTGYLGTCPGYFRNQVCQKSGSYYHCPQVNERTSIGSSCSFTLLADSVLSGGTGEQEVFCDFSTVPLFMNQAMVCADASSDSHPQGMVQENGKDNDESNCKSVSLNFTLSDLVPRGLTCKYSTDSTTWSNCLSGIDGATDWRIPDYADIKFAAKAKNTGDVIMPKAVINGMVYFLNESERCSYNVEVLEEGYGSDYIPDGSNTSEWCLIRNMNHDEHSGKQTLKACVDPKRYSTFGELFEKDDTDADNCMEKTLAIALPDLAVSLHCPPMISMGTPFSCTASISNLTDISMARDISPGQGVVFYLDGEEIDWLTMDTGNDCRFGLSRDEANGNSSQSCEITLSDGLPHTIKACVDPKDGKPPYGAQFEEDDTNESNCDEATVMVVVPDFTLDAFSFACPDTIIPGQGFTCEVEVRNNNEEANYILPVPIAFFVGNRLIRRINHVFTPIREDISSGSMKISESDVPASGEVSLSVRIDPDNDVYESSAQGHEDAESNNYAVIDGITSVTSFHPNFTILDNTVKCHDDDLIVKTGEIFACEAKIKNAGNIAPSKSFHSLFYSGEGPNSFLGMDFVDINVFPMKPGQIRTVLPIDLSLNEPGDYTVMACADRSISQASNFNLAPETAPGVVAEIDENDNCEVGPTIHVVDQLLANLSIADGESGCSVSSVAVNQKFSCFATVRNVGHVGSPAVDNGVVMYINGEPTFKDLNALSFGGGVQKFTWNSIVFDDDGGEYPRNITFEFCVDHPFPGEVEEYDDASAIRNNCTDFIVTVMNEDVVTADITLSSNTIRLGESVDVTVKAEDDQGVIRLGVDLAFDGSLWKSYNCEKGAVVCEHTWKYTPDWSGTRDMKGYAKGNSLSGEPEVVFPEDELTVLPAKGGGGNMAFTVLAEMENNAPVKGANVRVYKMGNTGLVGECSTDITGVCEVNIGDWGQEYTLLVQGYGYQTTIIEPYVPESFGGSVALMPINEEKVFVSFSIVQSSANLIKVKGATIKLFALAAGDVVASYGSPKILTELRCTTDDDGACGFEIYQAPEPNRSYTATVLHPDFLNAFFDFDVDVGSVGEAYQIPLEGSAGTKAVIFKVVDEPADKIISGATVKVVGIGSRLTDSVGECAFDLIPGVEYDIRVRHAGYNDYAFDDYDTARGGITFRLSPITEGGPSLVTENINNATGGDVVNEISAGVTATVSVPAGALPAGVNEAAVTISPVAPTAAAAAPAIANLPAGFSFIGSYLYDCSVMGGATFNTPVSISLTYTDEQVAGLNENNLVIYYYDGGSATWKPLATNVNAGTNTAIANTSHFSFFMLVIPQCYDSDPSQDINALGVVNYGADEWPDECVDDNTALQYKCDGTDFDFMVDFDSSDCLGLGCIEGVCRSADDRVGAIFIVTEEGGAAPLSGAEVSVLNIATGLEEGSCKTKAEGRCTIYLAIGAKYKVKVQHGNYDDINYGDLADINPLKPVPAIEMTGIPTKTVTYTLKRGLNLLFVSTVQPLDWSEVTAICKDAYKGFFVYSPTREEWGLSKQIHTGRAGYVLKRDRGECTVNKTGHDTGFSLLISLAKGTNLFQVPESVSFNEIKGSCEVEELGGVPMLEKYRANKEDKKIPVGLGEDLVPGTSYWIKVKATCQLSKI